MLGSLGSFSTGTRSRARRASFFRHFAIMMVVALVAGCSTPENEPTPGTTSPTTTTPTQTTPTQTTPTQTTPTPGGAANNTTGDPSEEGFTFSVLATNLSTPHNIIYGPDGALWVTERVGKNILRIDPDNGTRLSTMPVPDVMAAGGQDGLLGMAFHPGFLEGNGSNYLYVAYTYNATEVGDGDLQGRHLKITRFTYDPETQNISEPMDLISGLSGSIDHNGGRMTFGPDGKLYYTIGDQGKNQFSLYCQAIQAQRLPSEQDVQNEDWAAYEGKVLRMNPDGSIPDDNPEINGVRSHVFTYGHRNPQGIAVGPDGSLFISEHGDKSDDEFNRLEAGGNFGWPYIAGYQDNQAYQYVNWSAAPDCPSLPFDNIAPPPASVPVMNESEFNDTFEASNFVPPIQTFYTVETGYNFTDPACGRNAYVCWPTVAPSSVRLYNMSAIPGWENTFLMTTLKGGRIFQLTLNDEGTALEGEPVELFRAENRYRDVAFSPDGTKLFVITDVNGPVQALAGGASTTLRNPGSILVFEYTGTGTTA